MPDGSSGPGASGPSGSRTVRTAHRPAFGLILSITVTGIVGSTIVSPITPDIVADLGGGDRAIGLIVAAVAAPGILLAPIIGVLSDRYGRREVVVPCLVIFGVAGGLAAMAPTLGVLIGLRLLQGFGSAGLINLAVTIIGDHWDGVERARKIGQNAAVLTSAILIAPPLGGLLGSLFGWRAAFVPLWLAVVTGAVLWRALPPGVRHDASVADQIRTALPYLKTLTVIGAVGAGFITFLLIFGLFLTVMPPFLAREFGASPALRGLVAGAPAITSTIAALSLGRLRGGLRPKTLVAGSALCLAFAFGLISVAPAIWVVVLAVLVYGVGEGVMIPVLQDAVAGAAPGRSRGAVVALFVGFVRMGQTAGPLVAAQGLASLGARPTFAIGAGVAGCLGLLAPLGAWRLLSRRPRGGPADGGAVPVAR
ncbi:MAG: MFS transporter [Actinobacteria bacterium]|nr:MFS transporter [Actinomycetota bacterium]